MNKNKSKGTFSLMASWTRRVSVETLKTMSPVLASVSKKPTSCFSTASKYFFLSVPTCLSPVCIQHAISDENKLNHVLQNLNVKFMLWSRKLYLYTKQIYLHKMIRTQQAQGRQSRESTAKTDGNVIYIYDQISDLTTQ